MNGRVRTFAAGFTLLLTVVGAAPASAGEQASSEDSPSSSAEATEPDAPLELLRARSADPDTAMPTVMFRGTLRATVGYPIPLLRHNGWTWTLPALVELHDADRGDAFPSQLWRGHAGFELSWTGAIGRAEGSAGQVLALSAFVEHESDHASADFDRRADTFLYLNELGARASWYAPIGDWAAVTAVSPRFHFYSCTRRRLQCHDLAFGGAQTFEATLDFVLDGAGGRPAWRQVVFFGSLHGGYVLGTGTTVAELRLASHVGIRYRRRKMGTLYVMATGLFGNDVGWLRAERDVQLGAALRWSP
jgi:hypothetical protein